MSLHPSFSEFERLAGCGNLVPVYQEYLGDLDTPVSLYLKIRAKNNSFLLESADGSKRLDRYSYIGYEPFIMIRAVQGRVEVMEGGKTTTYPDQLDPFPVMRKIAQKYRPAAAAEPGEFQGGLVGFFNYDLVRAWEKLPPMAPEDPDLPEAVFMAVRRLIIFDHLTHKIKVAAFALLDEDKNLRVSYERAGRTAAETVAELQAPAPAPDPQAAAGELRADFKKEQYEQAVQRTKEYIQAGDIFQAVIAQRFAADTTGNPFWFYRRLRSINPSPYMFYLNFEEIQLIGASPEILVRLTDGKIELRPIAGSRPRGADRAEDEALQEELLRDAKERAEHIMLVDLGRNDAGKVAAAGTVTVPRLMEIESYSHIMHIVSHVEGRLRPPLDAFDVFRAAFPAGTVSGAPKIRAMEIIAELEPVRRGPYAGAVGYFAFNGNMDFCITIRTITARNHQVFIQAGAGIVYDSVPEKEYQETLKKAAAMFAALKRMPGHDSDDR